MKELFEALASVLAEENKTKENVPLFELDEDLFMKFKEMNREKGYLMDEMEVLIKKLELDIRRKWESVHDSFWEEVYSRYELDPDQSYNVNLKDKKLYQVLEKDEFPTPPWVQ